MTGRVQIDAEPAQHPSASYVLVGGPALVYLSTRGTFERVDDDPMQQFSVPRRMDVRERAILRALLEHSLRRLDEDAADAAADRSFTGPAAPSHGRTPPAGRSGISP